MAITAFWRDVKQNALFRRDLQRSGWHAWRIIALIIVAASLPVWSCVLATYAGGMEAMIAEAKKVMAHSSRNIDAEAMAGIMIGALINAVGAAVTLGSFLVTIAQWLTPVFIAPIIARERERGTWDLLRVTPMTTRQIVGAKFAGTLVRYPFWLLAVATFPMQIANATLSGAALGKILSSPALMSTDAMSPAVNWQAGLAGFIIGLLMVAQQTSGLWGAAGLAFLCSTWARRSSHAIMMAYALVIAVQMVGGGIISIVAYIMISVNMRRLGASATAPEWTSLVLQMGLPGAISLLYNALLGIVGVAWGLRRADGLAGDKD